MRPGFFTGWELWQKMTFVLAVTIALVLCVAYGKLVWMNRLLKKKEVIDEEMRAQPQTLRLNGGILKSSKADVPFGVRAIQSGIQVEGIWISNTNMPTPSEPGFEQKSSSHTGFISEVNTSIIGESPSSGLVRQTPTASTHTSPLKEDDSSSGFSDNTDQERTQDIRHSHRHQKARGRQNETYGVSDDVTFCQVEGKSEGNIPANARTQVNQPYLFQQKHPITDSLSAADNEIRSITSESNNSFSGCERNINASSQPLRSPLQVPEFQALEY